MFQIVWYLLSIMITAVFRTHIDGFGWYRIGGPLVPIRRRSWYQSLVWGKNLVLLMNFESSACKHRIYRSLLYCLLPACPSVTPDWPSRSARVTSCSLGHDFAIPSSRPDVTIQTLGVAIGFAGNYAPWDFHLFHREASPLYGAVLPYKWIEKYAIIIMQREQLIRHSVSFEE